MKDSLRDSHDPGPIQGPAGAGNGQDGILGILQKIADGPERGRELRKVLRSARDAGYSMDELSMRRVMVRSNRVMGSSSKANLSSKALALEAAPEPTGKI
jgi:hypothetical protein